MYNKNYWDERVHKNGHTGWSDNFIYAYDQQARLIAINSIISSIECSKNTALDFGCGTGDFSNLLSGYFSRVISFDISEEAVKIAKQKYRNDNISFYYDDNIEKIGILPNSIDLILSITVLDHILDDTVLFNTLNFFYNILNNNGALVVLEYAMDTIVNASSYQRFAKYECWISTFSKHDFCLENVVQFYHPTLKPCLSFNKYIKNKTKLSIRILNLLSYINKDTTSKYYNNLAKNYLYDNDFFWHDMDNKSPLKIMIFRKSIKV